jgi:prepilin-type N-terminal cleavage/methylation domain-containing protein
MTPSTSVCTKMISSRPETTSDYASGAATSFGQTPQDIGCGGAVGQADHRAALKRRGPQGFSLLEALVAITIMAIAGSAILWGVTSAVQATDDNLQQALAVGMAQQLMDEIIGARYHAVGSDAYEYPLSASSWEKNGQGRERYNDIDDYNGLRYEPPIEHHGTEIGMGDGTGDLRHPAFRVGHDYFNNWRQEIDVYYVDPDDFTRRLPPWSTSDYRAVEVRIVREVTGSDPRILAQLRQVVCYVHSL